MCGNTASEGEKRDAYKVLVIKPEGRRSLGMYRRELAMALKWMSESNNMLCLEID